MTVAVAVAASRERPIIFSGPMVRAILEGRKTQTRRVVARVRGTDTQPLWDTNPVPFSNAPDWWTDHEANDVARCPYGVPGDRLWVRETFFKCTGCNPGNGVIYRADNTPNAHLWRPSIYMPRWASRITLEVTGVRVERVQSIQEADAIAEGVTIAVRENGALAQFRELWNSINAKRGYGWDVNPWVWVIEFRHAQ